MLPAPLIGGTIWNTGDTFPNRIDLGWAVLRNRSIYGSSLETR
jgi:hypothetical protein